MGSYRQHWQETLKRLGRQFGLPRARVLQRRLTEVRDENRAMRLELEAVQDAIEAGIDRQARSLVDLQEKLEQLEEERHTAAQQVATLQASLSQAVSRQESTEQRVMALDDTLQETRASHRAEIREAHDRLRRQSRRSNGALLVAAMAMLLVAVTTVTGIQDVRENARVLAGVGRDLKDIKSAVEQQLAGKGELLAADPRPGKP